MKKNTVLLLVTVAGLALSGVLAYSQVGSADTTPPAASDGPPGTPAGDLPKPGQHLKELLQKYDVNHDGILDKDELAALNQAIDEGKIGPPPGAAGRGPRRGARPGMAGPPSAQDVLDKFDADKDGKLDASELASFLADMQKHRPPPPGRFGPGAGGPPMDGARRGGPPMQDGPPPEQGQ